MSIRVAVIDDQVLVRSGFSMILESEDDISVVAQGATGLEAVAIASNEPLDVMLMDIRMPELDGLEATRVILGEHERPVRIIVLTTFDPDEHIYQALRAGASGFLLKDTPPHELVSAIRSVSAGGALRSPSITRRLIGPLCRPARDRHSACSSAREPDTA